MVATPTEKFEYSLAHAGVGCGGRRLPRIMTPQQVATIVALSMTSSAFDVGNAVSPASRMRCGLTGASSLERDSGSNARARAQIGPGEVCAPTQTRVRALYSSWNLGKRRHTRAQLLRRRALVKARSDCSDNEQCCGSSQFDRRPSSLADTALKTEDSICSEDPRPRSELLAGCSWWGLPVHPQRRMGGALRIDAMPVTGCHRAQTTQAYLRSVHAAELR